MKTKTEVIHTSTPWEIFTRGHYSSDGVRKGWAIGICGSSREKKDHVGLIEMGDKCTHPSTEEANAQLIVRAVNSHEELLEWVKTRTHGCAQKDCLVCKEKLELIAKAEGE